MKTCGDNFSTGFFMCLYASGIDLKYQIQGLIFYDILFFDYEEV